MEWPSTSWGFCPLNLKDMIEQTKEELQILEDQEPNRFNYLKLELRSFISHLESQNLLLSSSMDLDSTPVRVASSVSTQESSAGKKSKKICSKNGEHVELPKQKLENDDDGCSIRRNERIDVVVERARACLHKIQQLKASFI